MSIIGGRKASSAAKKQARAQNEAAQRQYEYDLKAYGMDKEKMIANHKFLTEKIQNQIANESLIIKYKDDLNQQKYNYDLQIRNYQQDKLQRSFEKSEQVTAMRMNLATMEGESAREKAATKFHELNQSVAFEAQDSYIAQIEQEMALTNNTGRSAAKLRQNATMKRALSHAKLAETVRSGSRDYMQTLKDISLDETSEKLSAWANKMLKPGVLPMPPKPIPTPVPTYQMPRPLEDFDFGPEPILGAQRSVSGAGSAAFWGSAGGTLSSGVGNLITALA